MRFRRNIHPTVTSKAILRGDNHCLMRCGTQVALLRKPRGRAAVFIGCCT